MAPGIRAQNEIGLTKSDKKLSFFTFQGWYKLHCCAPIKALALLASVS
jgi:hypothetical protein